MNESTSVASSSLAITEKRPRRTGGCVGIFFQLFDWNRRFAKKKLFCKRLLPPDRAKEASKKFGGDEKLPKLRLIADENSGGFPNMNKNGVSSLNSNEGKNGVQTPSLVARLMGLESMPSVKKKDSSGEIRGGLRDKVVGDSDEFEKEAIKQEFRPQKLQKTGMIERRTVTRFGAEALQLKNVLSRSRKHHHPKLASPVKNTGHHSRRNNTSRLIGAATRMLEPGLQARSKNKSAITYTHNTRFKNDNLDLSGTNHLNGQPSCKNCGNLLDVNGSTSKRDAQIPVFDSINLSSQVSNVNSRYIRSSFNQDQEQDFSTNRMPRNFASPIYFKDNLQNMENISQCGDAVPFPSQSKFSDTKDFVALNRSLSGRARSRVPTKVEDTKLSQGQKRHLTHMRKQGESSASNNWPRMVSSVVSNGKQTRQMDHQGQSNKNSDGMMFKFSSQMKHMGEVPSKVERRRTQNVSSCKTAPRKKYISSQSDEKIYLQKPFPLTGDSLGALLEEKLKELTSRVGDESGMNPKRTTANIFQELICALNMERSVPQTYMEFSPQKNRKTSLCLQTKSEKTGALFGYKNSDHLSPGSVLEASFSNDSCCSSSLEDGSGHTHQTDSLSYSYDESQLADSETDPFYSGVLLTKEKTLNDYVSNLLIYISQVLSSISHLDTRLIGIKGSHAKEVIFNTELVLGNQTRHNSNKTISFFVTHFLLDELDTLAEVMWKNFSNFLESFKKGYEIKGFVFDCLIEYLDSKYGSFSKCGFRVMTSEILIREVVEEVKRWGGFVGLVPDELIEWDMSSCLGKWTDFELEAFENGAEIEGGILEMLVDEIIFDFMTVIGC